MMPGIAISFVAAMVLIRILYRDISTLKFQEPPELVGKTRTLFAKIIDISNNICNRDNICYQLLLILLISY
jgi:hypothetical protein